jgi:hypothetical protein
MGPYESDEDAFGDCADLYRGSAGEMVRGNEERLLAACAAAGVVLGDFDRHVLGWLAGFEPTTVQVLVGLIGRAAQGGQR